MDSINKQQPEQNHLDLRDAAAISKIQEIAHRAKTCFFCTQSSGGLSHGIRPMSVQLVDNEGNCWFLSANDSHKNQELKLDGTVDLYFQGSAHSDFLYLAGTAEISADKDKIKQLWEPIAKVWFTEGEDDPRISVIKVTPRTGYYWDNKHGDFIAGAKMAAGAVLGKTLDDSVEGSLSLS